MTVITRINETRRGRFALFSGEEFLFSIDGETLYKQGIVEQTQLTAAQLDMLRRASDTRRAKDAALRYLSLRAYGEQELYQKLCLKYDEMSAAAALAEMCRLDLLNDAAFAQEKACGMAQRGKNSTEIRYKLCALGIAEPYVQQAMQAAQIDDFAAAVRLLRKSYVSKLQNGQTDKVLAALCRKGYAYSVARDAIEEILAELAQEEPFSADFAD